MSSAGHILDMINRIKQNKSLRKRKKFKADHRENSYSENFDPNFEYDFPKVSKIELEHIKGQIRSSARDNHRKSLYVLIAITLLVAIAGWFFISNYKISAF